MEALLAIITGNISYFLAFSRSVARRNNGLKLYLDFMSTIYDENSTHFADITYFYACLIVAKRVLQLKA